MLVRSRLSLPDNGPTSAHLLSRSAEQAWDANRVCYFMQES